MGKPTSPPIGTIFIVLSFLTGCATSVPEQHIVQNTNIATNQGANEKVQRLRDSSSGASRISRECIRYHEILHKLRIRGSKHPLASNGRNELAQIRAVVSPLCLSTTPVGSPSVARDEVERGIADLQQLLRP